MCPMDKLDHQLLLDTMKRTQLKTKMIERRKRKKKNKTIKICKPEKLCNDKNTYKRDRKKKKKKTDARNEYDCTVAPKV